MTLGGEHVEPWVGPQVCRRLGLVRGEGRPKVPGTGLLCQRSGARGSEGRPGGPENRVAVQKESCQHGSWDFVPLRGEGGEQEVGLSVALTRG